MAFKMIFSDMDGTLLKSVSEISQKNADKIKEATSKGVAFVLCTGRGVYGVEKFLAQLGLVEKEGYVICQNGAAVYDLSTMNLLLRHNFSAETLRPVVECARKMDIEIYLYDDRTFLAEAETEETRRYCRVMGADMRILPDGLSYDGYFTKCLLSAPFAKLQALRQEVAPLVADSLDMFYSSDVYLEFVKKGVNKGRALQETATKAGVPLSEVIAIGDSDNDLPMIQAAGLGIAVANAKDHIKEKADYVTTNTCEQDAVAEVIDKFILGKDEK